MDVLREVLLPKLEAVRYSSGSWMARCPAHEDGKASLHISRGDTQPVVLKCHAGCDPVDILTAIGLTWDTLCAPREERPARGEWTPFGDAVAVYDYTDAAGDLLFQVLRTADKRFSQRVPDAKAKSGYRWRLDGTQRVPYRLPKIIAAVSAGEVVYIAEGEKDVHALEAAGVTATCNPGGAGKWRPEYAEHFRDAIVRIVADADKPGRAHARSVAASLDGIAAAVEITEAAEGKDAADHLAAGKGLADLLVTVTGEHILPELAPDLHEFLSGDDPPPEWVIPGLMEYGDRLIWTGREGLGKSVAVRQLAIAAAAGIQPFTDYVCDPRRVLLIDCENPLRLSRRHFRGLEFVARHKQRRVPDGGFRIIHRPEGVDLSREEEAAWLLERVTAHKPELLVIGPLYKLHALDINEELAARTIVSVLDAAMAVAGCALIVEAHAPHGEPGKRPLRPVGSSLFMRWPEFGYGITPAKASSDTDAEVQRGGRKPDGKPDDGKCRHVAVRPWRGARDERDWPRQLIWGHPGLDWPWIPFRGGDDENPGLHAVRAG